MAGLIYELMDVLEKENKKYIDLITYSEDKTQIIIDENIKGLQSITIKEHEIINKLTLFEKKREELIKDICVVLNVNYEEFTFEKLVKKMQNSQDEVERLLNIKNIIFNNIKKLKNINEKNKKLLDESINYVEYTLNAIKSSNNIQQNYSKYGNKNGYKASNGGYSLFDTKS